MNCQDVRKHCQPFLDNELQSEQAKMVQQHLGDCPQCAEAFDSQRTFHTLIKKVLCKSAEQRAIPGLKERVISRLRRGSRPSEIRRAVDNDLVQLFSPNVRHLPANRGVAVAAAAMFFLTGIVGFQSLCVGKACSLVAAAQHEHENIIAGNRPVLVRGTDTEQMNKTLAKIGGPRECFPNLSGCKLTAEGCGELCIPGLPKGYFVKYAHCHCNDEAVTLMCIKTKARPSADAIGEFLGARRNGRTVISWETSDKTLYLMVTGLPLDEALEVAKVAKR